jgi:Transposase
VPLQWRIFPPGAAKIREGEMEHCEDLQSSEEFKTRAVRLALDEGKTVGAVARDLDLTASAAASGSNTRWPSGRRARAV